MKLVGLFSPVGLDASALCAGICDRTGLVQYNLHEPIMRASQLLLVDGADERRLNSRLLDTLRFEAGADALIRIAEARFREHDSPRLICGVTHKHEAEWIRRTGGFMIHVRHANWTCCGATLPRLSAGDIGIYADDPIEECLARIDQACKEKL